MGQKLTGEIILESNEMQLPIRPEQFILLGGRQNGLADLILSQSSKFSELDFGGEQSERERLDAQDFGGIDTQEHGKVLPASEESEDNTRAATKVAADYYELRRRKRKVDDFW